MRRWNHYKALVFKNSILWRRRIGGSIVEVIFTIFMLFFILLIRLGLPIEDKSAESQLDDIITLSNSVTADSRVSGLPDCASLVNGGTFKIGLGPTGLDIYDDLRSQINAYFSTSEDVVKAFESDSDCLLYTSDAADE